MRNRTVITRTELATLGHDPARVSPTIYHDWPRGDYYYVELPSGMRHWFRTERDARSSQYWPYES